MSITSSFRVGSITKSFTGYVMYLLILDGKISPTTLVSTILTKYQLDSKITIQHLLHHTSGLPDYIQYIDDNISVDNMIRKCTPSYYSPGNGWNYSNTNYYLLGKVIEKITNDTILNVYTELIFTPLGLCDTTVNKSHMLTCGYMVDHGAFINQSNEDINYAFGCGDLVSTARDLSLFMSHYSKICINLPMVMSPRGKYGYGVGVLRFNGKEWYGHGGSINGYESLVYTNPATNTTVVVLANTDNDKPATTLGYQLLQQ